MVLHPTTTQLHFQLGRFHARHLRSLATLYFAPEVPSKRWVKGDMDIVKGLISAIVMIAAIGAVIGLVAAMFMIVFSIAIGVDEKLQD